MANNHRNQRERSRGREEAPYEEMVEIYKENLDIAETFHYQSVMNHGDHGKEGRKSGLLAMIYGLREKVGTDGILKSLLAQGMQCIENGENPTHTLASAISDLAGKYLGSALLLKAKDLIPYLQSRLEGVEIIAKKDYEDIQLKDLVNIDREGHLRNPRNEKEKYGFYLFEQLQNAVMTRGTSVAYQEKARMKTEEYNGVENIVSLADARSAAQGYRRGRAAA